tara:strand:- start:2203 stop:3018 length:816 start_codon:yes stop_codon:yes gene_type:complete
MMKVLSLGAGVQSSTLLLMSCHGDLPPIDAAVFADTMWEPSEVYRWLKDVLTPVAAAAGIPIHTVSAGDLRADALRSTVRAHVDGDTRSASLPLHVTQPGCERGGMLRRQCTKEYKIAPIRRKCRELLGAGPRGRIRPGAVEMWIGISADEAARMKPSGVQWVHNVYPLIDHDPPMRRSDCHAWLHRHGYDDAPRSACNGCPFRSAAEWRHLKQDEDDWSDAVEFDAAIRHRDMRGGEAFIHRDLVPLADAVHDDPTERLWDDECSGHCGV